jgi:hypothetical protein
MNEYKIINSEIDTALKVLGNYFLLKLDLKKKIDFMVHKINFQKTDFTYWINFVNVTLIEMYMDANITDLKEIENFEFSIVNESEAYFIYKILENIKLEEKPSKYSKMHIGFKINKKEGYYNNIFNKYFIDLLHYQEYFFSNKNELDDLDQRMKKIEALQLSHQGRHKSVSGVLLGIQKNKSYRVNTDATKIDYKVKKFNNDNVKEIECPVCHQKFTISYKNKKEFFINLKEDKYKFLCNHESSKEIYKKVVEINLKDYITRIHKENINLIDFIIYNHKYLFAKYLNGSK